MAFAIASPGKPGKSLRKTIRKQIGRAADAAAKSTEPIDRRIHSLRTHLKKARAGLLLARNKHSAPGIHCTAEILKDSAKPAGELRDADVCLETLTSLHRLFGDRFPKAVYRHLCDVFESRQRRIRAKVAKNTDKLKRSVKPLKTAEAIFKRIPIEKEKWQDIEGGLKRSFARASARCLKASKRPDARSIHEWRKEAQILRYQIDFLTPLWPARMGALSGELHGLTDSLGKHHDLMSLREAILTEPKKELQPEARELVLSLIDEQAEALKQRCLSEGLRIFSVRPKAFSRQIGRYFHLWKEERLSLSP